MYKIFISFIFACLIYIPFEYEINEFNTKIRNLIVHQKFTVREFDNKGIPQSYSARQGNFVSPYYVIHYGLRFSDSIFSKINDKRKNILWYEDTTQQFWNVEPPEDLISEVNFKNTLDWLIDHVDYRNGNIHLFYDFRWEYQDLPVTYLEPGWWSGLADSLAMNLFLRAYLFYGDEKYLNFADEFYKSLITDVHLGGSYDKKEKFIIEYASKDIKEKEFPYVLNGAYYAFLNIKSYEEFREVRSPVHGELLDGLLGSVSGYFRDGWSDYDRLKGMANIKYNNINYEILKQLIINAKSQEDKRRLMNVLGKRGNAPYLFYAIKYHFFGYLVIHLLLTFIAIWSFLFFILRTTQHRYLK